MAFRRNLFLAFCACVTITRLPALAQSTSAPRQANSPSAVRQKSATATPALPPGTGLTFAPAVAYNSGGNGGNSVAVADLNGDTFPDLVVADWCTSTCPNGNVGVLLGKGDGTFSKPTVSYSSGGQYADAIAVADLRGNGELDLIVGNCGSTSGNICVGTNGGVGVLLGKGDGTFQAAVSYFPAYGVAAVAVADVNGDGKLDVLIATNCPSGGSYDPCVGVMLGNGDGTFSTTTIATYSSGAGAYSPSAIAVGDLNGDGKPDVVVAHCGTSGACGVGSGTVGVLLNNGDGTFASGVLYFANGIYSDGVAIADVNGDGKLDVIVANSSTSNSVNAGDVGVLLGNGDGTFQTKTAVAYPSGGYGAASVAVVDVNGDEKLDLIVANCSSTSGACTGSSGTVGVGVLLGNGDGTFQSVITFGSGGNTPFALAVGDFNGDSKPDIVTANCASNVCGGSLGVVGVLLNTSLGGTSTKLTSVPNPSVPGQSVTFTATVKSAFTGTPTGTVNFFNGTTNIGSSALNSSAVATLITATLPAGSDSITATYSGDTNFVTSTSSALTQPVQAVSTTTLSLSASTVASGASVTLTAQVSSTIGTPANGETVTFKDATTSVTLGSGTLTTGKATFTSTTIPAGTYSVVASYPGDSQTQPSASTAQTLIIQGASSTVLGVSANTVAFGASVTFTAQVSSTVGTPANGETVTFKDTVTNKALGTGTLSSGTATFTSTTIAAGTYSVVASYPGDATTMASVSGAQPLNVQNFTLSANPKTVTISAPGQMGSTTITITTYGNLSPQSLGGFSCSGLPALTTCAFAAGSSSSTASLTIQTAGAADLLWPALGHHQGMFYAMLLPGLLGVVGLSGQKRKLRGLQVMTLLAVLSIAAMWSSCGGSSSTTKSGGTPPGTSTVTVSATSGTLKGSTTFTLVVN